MPPIVPTDHPRYFSDGSGRDSYIHLDNGGLRPVSSTTNGSTSLSLRPHAFQLNHITPIHGNHRVGSTTSLPKMRQARIEQAKRQRQACAALSTPRTSRATRETLAQAYPYQSIPVTLPQSVLSKTVPLQEAHYHAQYAHTTRHHPSDTKTSPRKYSQYHSQTLAQTLPTTITTFNHETKALEATHTPTQAVYYDGKTMTVGAPPQAYANTVSN